MENKEVKILYIIKNEYGNQQYFFDNERLAKDFVELNKGYKIDYDLIISSDKHLLEVGKKQKQVKSILSKQKYEYEYENFQENIEQEEIIEQEETIKIIRNKSIKDFCDFSIMFIAMLKYLIIPSMFVLMIAYFLNEFYEIITKNFP